MLKQSLPFDEQFEVGAALSKLDTVNSIGNLHSDQVPQIHAISPLHVEFPSYYSCGCRGCSDNDFESTLIRKVPFVSETKAITHIQGASLMDNLYFTLLFFLSSLLLLLVLGGT